MKTNIKLIARYLALIFFMYLANKITSPEFAIAIKDVGEIGVAAIYTSVFGAVAYMLKAHFETRIGD